MRPFQCSCGARVEAEICPDECLSCGAPMTPPPPRKAIRSSTPSEEDPSPALVQLAGGVELLLALACAGAGLWMVGALLMDSPRGGGHHAGQGCIAGMVVGGAVVLGAVLHGVGAFMAFKSRGLLLVVPGTICLAGAAAAALLASGVAIPGWKQALAVVAAVQGALCLIYGISALSRR